MLFYLVTGHLPFSGSNPSLILKNVIEGNRPNVSELAPSMSASLADVVERLLSTSAEDRFNTAQEVEEALLDCLTEVQIDMEDERWNLKAYLEDPEGYDARLDAHLRVALLEQGQRFLERGDHLAALRLLNRLLSIDHDNEEVLALVQNLHGQTGPSGRRRLWLAAGALAAVGSAVGGLWMLAQRVPEVTETGERAEMRQMQAAEPDPQVVLPEMAAQTPIELSEPTPARPSAPVGGDSEPSQEPPEQGAPTSALAARDAPPPGDGPPPSSRRRVVRRDPAAAAPPPEPQELEYATVVINTHGLAAEVYSGGRRVGDTSEEIRLRAGSHELEIRSPYVHTHTQPVVVSPGERTVVPVTLQVRAARVVFPAEWPADCRVTLTDETHQAEDVGSIGTLSRLLRLEHPHRPVSVGVSCTDGPPLQRQWPHLAGEVRFPAPPSGGGTGRTVTVVSRFRGTFRSRVRRGSGRSLGSAIRHVSCTLLLAGGTTGCLYFAPIVRKTDNEAPLLLSPTEQRAQEEIVFPLVSNPSVVTIIATDRDGDEIDIIWSMGSFDTNQYEMRTGQAPSGTSFAIVLPRNPKFHGQLLQADLYDPQLEVKTVRFRLEVP